MAANYPTDADLIRFLYAAGLVDSATAPTGRAGSLDYLGAVNAAKAEFERRTNRTYKAAAATRTYSPPTDSMGLLDLECDWATITSVVRDGQTLVVGDDYHKLPWEGPPYRFIEFVALVMEPLPWASRGTIVVTGTRGSASTVPDDVFQAVLQRGAAHLAPSLHGILTQGAQSIKQADAAITYGGGKSLGSLSQDWLDCFEQAVTNHMAGGLIF